MSIIWKDRKQAVSETSQLVKSGVPLEIASLQVIPKYVSSKNVQPTPNQLNNFRKQVLEHVSDMTDEKKKQYALVSNVQFKILREIEKNEMVNITDISNKSLTALLNKGFVEVIDYIVCLSDEGKKILSTMPERKVIV